MAISKLILNGVVQMDVTLDTVTAQTLLENETATGADGEQVVGSYVAPTPRTASDVTVSGATVTIPSGAYASQVQKSVATGTAGTPTATKGTVSNHAVSVTPSVTNVTGYITGGTKSGTAVTVSASELVSGTKSITQNGTGIDVAEFSTVDVNVSGGGSAVIQPLSVSANGTYTAPTGVDGYSPVTVSVSGGGGQYYEQYQQILQDTFSGSLYNDELTILKGYLFRNNSNITGANVPNAVTIGSYCFCSCINLSYISFPNCETIERETFCSCKISTVNFSKVTQIQTGAFMSCLSLTTAILPMAKSIYASAFGNCFSLATLSVPEVEWIDGFYGCSELSELSLPKASFIGTFNRCIKLTNVYAPSATSISVYAFNSDYALSTVILSAVTSIGNSAFAYCSSLESLYLLGSSCPSIASRVFSGTPFSNSSYLGRWGSIFVKESLLSTFKAAKWWSSYSARIVGLTDAQISALG